jgi:hypothetical protein
MTFRANGKQVLTSDGGHVADCSTPALASTIAAALNLPAILDARASRANRAGNRSAARIYRILADDLRAGVMEE